MYKIVTILGVVYQIGAPLYDNSGAMIEDIEYEHSSLDPQTFIVQFSTGISVEVRNPVEIWRRPERPSPWVNETVRKS